MSRFIDGAGSRAKNVVMSQAIESGAFRQRNRFHVATKLIEYEAIYISCLSRTELVARQLVFANTNGISTHSNAHQLVLLAQSEKHHQESE